MDQLKNLLKQRRIWAGLSATIAFFLPLTGYTSDFNHEQLTDVIMALINSISGILAIILPIWSYYKPKKK